MPEAGEAKLHACGAWPYCREMIPANKFACEEHWKMLSRGLRLAVWLAWANPRSMLLSAGIPGAKAWLRGRLGKLEGKGMYEGKEGTTESPPPDA